MTPDRRTVLKGLGAAGAVAAVGTAGWIVRDDGGSAPPATTEVPRTPEPPSSLGAALVAVGGRYLEAFPDEADRSRLLQALPALDGTVPEWPGRALRVLSEQAAADHEAGEVVDLDGWVLSRTECRAAALYAL